MAGKKRAVRKDRANNKTRLRYGKAIGIVRLEFKITMNNMLRVLMGKVNSMQE